jgi:hypothetical protein
VTAADNNNVEVFWVIHGVKPSRGTIVGVRQLRLASISQC